MTTLQQLFKEIKESRRESALSYIYDYEENRAQCGACEALTEEQKEEIMRDSNIELEIIETDTYVGIFYDNLIAGYCDVAEINYAEYNGEPIQDEEGNYYLYDRKSLRGGSFTVYKIAAIDWDDFGDEDLTEEDVESLKEFFSDLSGKPLQAALK